jgi:hypothetical protein
MDTMRTIIMSLREISRLKTIQAVAEGNLRAVTAAAQLGLCRRQIDRLADRYRDDGPSGLVSKKRGLQHHQLPASAVDLALSIIRERYADFGPTLACEKLRERHGITLAKETVRKAGVFRDNHKQNDHGPGVTQFGRCSMSSTSISGAPIPARPKDGWNGPT